MERKKRVSIVFSVIAFFMIVASARVFINVYVFENFPIFTDEEQISVSKEASFGFIAEHL